jgi:hypothetical protein
MESRLNVCNRSGQPCPLGGKRITNQVSERVAPPPALFLCATCGYPGSKTR